MRRNNQTTQEGDQAVVECVWFRQCIVDNASKYINDMHLCLHLANSSASLCHFQLQKLGDGSLQLHRDGAQNVSSVAHICPGPDTGAVNLVRDLHSFIKGFLVGGSNLAKNFISGRSIHLEELLRVGENFLAVNEGTIPRTELGNRPTSTLQRSRYTLSD